MRISTSQIFQSGVTAMQRGQVEQNRTNLQLSTGRRILTAADDPSGATIAMRLNAAISDTQQYQRNSDFAWPRLAEEETQIASVETALQQARDLVLAGSDSSYNAQDRKTVANQIRQLRDTIMGFANTKDSNGEYLFAGTRSSVQPFVENASGAVTYAGADGADAVRRVQITPTRSVQVGDTGKSVFVAIPEQSGKVLEGVLGVQNAGDVVVQHTEIADAEAFERYGADTLTVHFTDDQGSYEVLDADGSPLLDPTTGSPVTGTYSSGADSSIASIQFAGRSISLTGDPESGDTITSRTADTVSIFDTLDAIATTLESDVGDATEARQRLSDAADTALRNIDSSFERLTEVRASIGVRLNDLEGQSNANDERLLNLDSTLSAVQDLDYLEAISRFKRQQVVLEAAQKSYVQVSRLSLFDFL